VDCFELAIGLLEERIQFLLDGFEMKSGQILHLCKSLLLLVEVLIVEVAALLEGILERYFVLLSGC
jgi:hypothetical protein